ncbi:hypothetical protein J3R82DRAFT_1900 [Butyriboletus roseoflavus]|nr:hypothetical protein J3R82DRAFT_1900 [Butyriboletus roseoflavus]
MEVDDPLWARLFARAPIYDLIFSCLSPRSLARLALTSRAAYLAIAAFKIRAFNINRHFSRFFNDPLAFRSLQAKTNTLVSGSDALQFLDRSFYPEADLDLYTHPGHSFEVARFLVEAEGYHFAPREQQGEDWKVAIGNDWDGTESRIFVGVEGEYPLGGIKTVWTFQKTGVNQQRLKIQIIEAASSPLEAILEFHSTCVMNFITSNAAYALYPFATFEEGSSLGMPSARGSPEAIQKYVQRGWRIYFMPTPYDMEHPKKSPFLLDQVRWVGDKQHTGVKERTPLSPASAPLTFDPVLCNGWKLRLIRGHILNGYECHSYPLQTTVFRYNYAIPDERLLLGIRGWAHQQGRYSHGQVSKQGWVWFDADIPGFLCKD